MFIPEVDPEALQHLRKELLAIAVRGLQLLSQRASY